MTRYVVFGLIAIVVAGIYFARRFWRSREAARDPSEDVDLLLWQEDVPTHPRQPDFGNPAEEGSAEDTAPAVLSPPERERPRSASNGSRGHGGSGDAW